MPSCQKDILQIPLSPSAPAPTDVVMFTLQDGTTVIRQWSTIAGNLTGLPDDEEFTTLPGGSNTDNFINGNSQIFLTNFIGKRIRVNRGSVPQSILQGQYTWNKLTAELNVTPSPVTGEIWQIQAY